MYVQGEVEYIRDVGYVRLIMGTPYYIVVPDRIFREAKEAPLVAPGEAATVLESAVVAALLAHFHRGLHLQLIPNVPNNTGQADIQRPQWRVSRTHMHTRSKPFDLQCRTGLPPGRSEGLSCLNCDAAVWYAGASRPRPPPHHIADYCKIAWQKMLLRAGCVIDSGEGARLGIRIIQPSCSIMLSTLLLCKKASKTWNAHYVYIFFIWYIFFPI